MSNLQKGLQKYRVRCLFGGVHNYEHIDEDLDYQSACERFIFYVQCHLELGLDLRCVNIMKGKRSIKMFSTYGS